MNTPSTPIISVIIPAYNHAHFIDRALQSLLDQTYTNWEAIIIDNHSLDNTDEVVGGFSDSRITLLKINNNGVIAASRNMGIRAAKGDWVAFLDADDWWTPRKLELSFSALKAGADLVYHDLYTVSSLNQNIFNERIVSTEPRYPLFNAFLCTGMSIPNSSVVVRRELLIQVGGMSEKRDLISVEDYDTWIRLSRLTEMFVRIPDCLGYYWIGGGNNSSASPTQCTRIKALYDQYIGELNKSEYCQAKGFLAYRIGRIAQMYGDREKAQSNLLIAVRSPIQFLYRAKAIYFLLRNMLS